MIHVSVKSRSKGFVLRACLTFLCAVLFCLLSLTFVCLLEASKHSVAIFVMLWFCGISHLCYMEYSNIQTLHLRPIPSTPLDHSHGSCSLFGDLPQLHHGKIALPVQSSNVPSGNYRLLMDNQLHRCPSLRQQMADILSNCLSILPFFHI